MKKTVPGLLAVLVLACCSVPLSACEICGCSGGGNSLGLLPLVQRHFVGFRAHAQYYTTQPHGGETASKENFANIDLWGRWQMNRRWQLIGILPYSSAERIFNDGVIHRTKGLGDLSLIAQFALLDPAKQAVKPWRYTAQIGAGLKMPTGVHDLRNEEGVLHIANLQPGSGAYDFLLSGLYAVQYNTWGISADASLRLTGENAEKYKIGNRLNAELRLFWNRQSRQFRFLPYAGLSLDARDVDRDKGIWQADSGGKAWFAVAGIDFFWGNCLLSLSGKIPLAHSLGGDMVTPGPRIQGGVAWLFGRKTKVMAPSAVFPPAVQQ